jgi:hypothetical protein
MRAGFTTTILAAAFALPVIAAENFEYNMITGLLPGTEIVAADVVRQPDFRGEKDEKVQAMDQAKTRLDSEYCNSRGGAFVVDNGLVVFDDKTGTWLIGGVCR